MQLRKSYHPYAWVTILFWSLAFVFTRILTQSFSVFALGFLRYLVASAALAVIAVTTKLKLPKAKDIPWFILSGIVGFFLYMILFNQGQAMVSAATGSIVIATAPIITAILAFVIYHEKLSNVQWVAILVEFVGVAVLVLLNGTLSVNIGTLWLLGAAVLLSVYNILQKKLTRRYSPLQVTSYSIFFGTLLLAVFAPTAIGEAKQAPAIHFLYIAILGICSSAIAYLAWAKAFAKASKASQVSNYMFVTPFLTSVLGFLIVGEVPDTATVLGGGIIIAGIFLFNFGNRLLKVLRINHR